MLFPAPREPLGGRPVTWSSLSSAAPIPSSVCDTRGCVPTSSPALAAMRAMRIGAKSNQPLCTHAATSCSSRFLCSPSSRRRRQATKCTYLNLAACRLGRQQRRSSAAAAPPQQQEAERGGRTPRRRNARARDACTSELKRARTRRTRKRAVARLERRGACAAEQRRRQQQRSRRQQQHRQQQQVSRPTRQSACVKGVEGARRGAESKCGGSGERWQSARGGGARVC
jgi:hypothetical protein